MEKQIIRQLQQSGNRLTVCIAPEIREALQANKGDNLAFEIEPDSGVVRLSKVVLSNPGSDDSQDETNKDNKDESGITLSAELRVDGADKKTQGQQTNKTNIEFCPSCGSNEFDVTGNKIYCRKCDVLYESAADGSFRVVKLSPLADEVDDISQRLEQVEQDVQDIDEQLNPKSNKPDDDDWLDDYWGKDEDSAEVKVAVGAESDEDEELI